MWKFDIALNQWEVVDINGNNPFPLYSPSYTQIGTKIFLTGGAKEEFIPSGDTYELDTSEMVWGTLMGGPTISTGRSVVINKQGTSYEVITFGGEKDGVSQDKTYRYRHFSKELDDYITYEDDKKTTTKVSKYCTPESGDPVTLSNLEFTSKAIDFSIKGRNINFELIRTYKNKVTYSGPFGNNWSFNHSKRFLKILIMKMSLFFMMGLQEGISIKLRMEKLLHQIIIFRVL